MLVEFACAIDALTLLSDLELSNEYRALLNCAASSPKSRNLSQISVDVFCELLAGSVHRRANVSVPQQWYRARYGALASLAGCISLACIDIIAAN